MPYNHIIKLEKKTGDESPGDVDFRDLDFDDKNLVAIQVLTPYSIYRLEIQDSGLDLTDPSEKAENRRKEFKLVRGGHN